MIEAVNPSDEGYISKVELARRMDVSTRTIEIWMRERKVPFEKIGRTVRFHWGDVRDYLSRRSAMAVQPRDHLRPTEGTSDRLKELAASIRQRQRLNSHKPAISTVGNSDDNSSTPVGEADSVQSPNARLNHRD